MTAQAEEKFIHFTTCMRRFNGALRILSAIKANEDHPLAGPAFRFALVEYVAPYTEAVGRIQRGHRLPQRYIPSEFLELHERLVRARHKIHAHSDLTVAEAKLYLKGTKGRPSVEVTGKYVDELEELKNIDHIIEMIEGTLLNMYADQDAQLRSLYP
jgi:hypothetical protein